MLACNGAKVVVINIGTPRATVSTFGWLVPSAPPETKGLSAAASGINRASFARRQAPQRPMTTPTADACTSSRSMRCPSSKGSPTLAFGYACMR
jgi:hypothetical protein